MSPPWWAAFDPADTTLRCGDNQHRLRWMDGTLHALDHPDAEGELVLGALGGDTSPCLDLVMAWGRHSDDLTVLAFGPRSASDRLTVPVSVLDEITAVSGGAGLIHPGFAKPVGRSVSIGGTVSQPVSAAGLSLTFHTGHSGGAGRVGHHSGRGSSDITGHRGFPDRHWVRQILARLRKYGGVLALKQRWLLRGISATASRLARPVKFRRSAGWSAYAPVGWHGRSIGGHGLVSGFHGPPGWRGAEVDEARAELIRLLALGAPFQFRLSAAVAHAWSADGANAGRAELARPTLTAALSGRLAPAAADWLGIDPEEVEVSVHGDRASWGELALIKTGSTSRLKSQLPVGWLASVWAPGFAVVGGHLVVSVLDAAWPTAHVLAVRSPGQDPAELSIRNDKGHWSEASR